MVSTVVPMEIQYFASSLLQVTSGFAVHTVEHVLKRVYVQYSMCKVHLAA